MEKAGITAKSAEIAKVAVRGQIHETIGGGNGVVRERCRPKQEDTLQGTVRQ